MSNTATITGSSAGTLGGVSVPSINFSAQATFTENRAPVLYQTLSTTPTLLGLGGVTQVLAIVLQVLTGTGTQHVYLGLDNAFAPADLISDIPEGMGVVLIRPCAMQPAQIYASVDSGAIVVKYQVIAQ